jgi:hypothetical protein
MSNVRKIGRKYVEIELRGENLKIYSLSINDLDNLKNCINVLIKTFWAQLQGITKLNWKTTTDNGENSIPAETMGFINKFWDTITTQPLQLLEVASGLPHDFFDLTNKEKCLSISELLEIGEIVFEVNGLGFVVEAVRGWAKQTMVTMTSGNNTFLKSAPPFASGTLDTLSTISETDSAMNN